MPLYVYHHEPNSDTACEHVEEIPRKLDQRDDPVWCPRCGWHMERIEFPGSNFTIEEDYV